ncbi:hypothetical protein [Janthinobacterium agaricidamnosum]|nr:hypothetical protein [Janthinobacterium agaricidamnosum]
MKALQNMEIIFTVAVALACSFSYVSITQAQQKTLAAADNIPVVTISAKRLTPQQKAQSLAQERQQTLLASNADRF